MVDDVAPRLDQALFGYSDGHRLIASSTRLPPKDLYLLSGASDLASGTKLTGDESYLTGLPLPESRKYAVMRTWAAPEMPRPGCVWTHALVLDQRALSLLPAFSMLLPMFRRPSVALDRSRYEHAVEVDLNASVAPADDFFAARIIQSFYAPSGRRDLPPIVERTKLESSILAVWSQQWPRLRAAFSFQTAIATDRRRSETTIYDIQIAASEGTLDSPENWALFAGQDAAANEVSPLRRFLWRYSRDLTNSRAHYRTLVDLYAKTLDVKATPKALASSLFDAFPDVGDGAILKSDLISAGGHSAGMVPAVSVVDLIDILAEHPRLESPTSDQVLERLAQIQPDEVLSVAKTLDAHESQLSRWQPAIQEAIISNATRATLVPDFPESLLPSLLSERPELIASDVLSRLPGETVAGLLSTEHETAVQETIFDELMRRDLGATEDKVITTWPLRVLRSAVEASIRNSLDASWCASIPRHQDTLLRTPWLDAIGSTQKLTKAMQLLRYPRNPQKSMDELFGKIKTIPDDAAGPDRIDLHAYLIRLALDGAGAANWEILVAVLPEIRPKIVQESLTQFAHDMLTADLPRFYAAAYWDLDKRILLGLSRLYKKHPNDQALRDLRLSQKELEIVLEGERDEKRSSIWNPFSWVP